MEKKITVSRKKAKILTVTVKATTPLRPSTTASSPDRSPQTRKRHKASRENSASKKSQKFGELPPPSSTTNNITSNTLEEIQEITPSEIAFCVKFVHLPFPVCSGLRTISRSSRRIFRRDNAFERAVSAIYC